MNDDFTALFCCSFFYIEESAAFMRLKGVFVNDTILHDDFLSIAIHYTIYAIQRVTIDNQ